MQLRPELCGQVNITDIAKEISGNPDVTLLYVYDLPSFQVCSFRGYPGPELLRDQRFVDYNATSPDTNAELDKSSGHESQLQANNTEVLKSSQVLPIGILRTLQERFVNSMSTNTSTTENILNTNVTRQCY